MKKGAALLGATIVAVAFIAGTTAVASNRIVVPGLSGDSAGGSATATPTSPASTLGPGTWGMPDALLIVDSDGAASMEFACASAAITPPLAIGEDGQFSWTGRYTQGRPGPAAGETYDATFAGALAGDALHMVITVPGIPLSVDLDLRRGAPGPGAGCVAP